MKRLKIVQLSMLGTLSLSGVLLALSALAGTNVVHAAKVKVIETTASSEKKGYPARFATDGVISDESRWVSLTDKNGAWLEVRLEGVKRLAGIHLYSGYGNGGVVEAFTIRFWANNAWQSIPSAEVVGNQSTAVSVLFDQTVEVVTDRLRLEIRKTHQDVARVKEFVVWDVTGDVPALKSTAVALQTEIVSLYLNQSGFNVGAPKRFTAPTLAEGTAFVVRSKKGGEAAFKGVIKKHIGDFSAFDGAAGEGIEYVVEASGLTSVPFRIGRWWLERVTYQNAVNFMIDSRHYLGNYTNRCRGSFGWRDDHHFGWELNTLVPQLLSNPSAYDRMPRQIRYQAPGNTNLWGALQPYREDIPDLVKLIHWGADVIVSQGLMHEMLKSQLAYFLYAWPVLKHYLPEQNYRVVRDYAFAHWSEEKADHGYPYDESLGHNLFVLKTKTGSTKGAYPPGFTVQPNLLLYEVAQREKRPDVETYFKAAYQQVEWMIANLDWNNSQVTKGQRMSEFITMTGLSYFMKTYPDRVPEGLQKKLDEWVVVALRRSDNLWDFRKLGDGEDQWTPMGAKPQMWNEVGNVTGFPGALLAVKPFVKDPASKQRVAQLVWSHFDNMFGRNPVGRHFSYDASREIEGVENGWFSQYRGGIGQLSDARFVLDGAPKNGHYPFCPEKGNYGWSEGWIQFNTPFNLSLAYLAYEHTVIELKKTTGGIMILLTAPLNFDYGKREEGTVQVTVNGQERNVTVTEQTPDSAVLSAEMPARSGDVITVSYGYGYFKQSASITF
ncbi:MAG: discoidin domain-containing protein [bacterium]